MAGRRSSTNQENVSAVLGAGTAVIGSLAASELHVGEVGGKTVWVSVNPTLTVAASYASGDYVGTSAAINTMTGAVRVSGGTGVIQSVVVIDKAVQSLALELWFFNASVTVPNDSAAWTITDADALKCLGVIAVGASDYKASALNSVATLTNVGLVVKPTTGTDIFMAIVTRGAPAYATGDLQIALGILND